MSEKIELVLDDDAALAAAAADANKPTEEKLYAGKYKSVEDLEKGYAEAQAALSGRKPDETPTDDANKPAERTIPDNEEEAAKAANAAGLDWDALNAEFAEHQGLTPETMKALEGKGFPPEVVNAYIEGVKAQAARYDDTVMSTAGGKDEYLAMVTWAKDNLSPAEKKAFNAAVESFDEGQATLAVGGLRAKYEAVKGKSPALLDGKVGNSGGAQPFASQADMTRAMRDPRYRNDPKYRDEVRARVHISDF